MGGYPVNSFTKVVVPVSRGDEGWETPTYPVAADTTFVYGDIAKLSSGKLTQAIALPGTNNTFDLSGGSLGPLFFVLAPITTTGSPAETEVVAAIPLNEAVKLLMRTYNATAANTEQRDLSIGTAYQLGRWRGASASINWYAMGTTTTNGDLTLLQRSPESAADDDYGLNYWGKN